MLACFAAFIIRPSFYISRLKEPGIRLAAFLSGLEEIPNINHAIWKHFRARSVCSSTIESHLAVDSNQLELLAIMPMSMLLKYYPHCAHASYFSFCTMLNWVADVCELCAGLLPATLLHSLDLPWWEFADLHMTCTVSICLWVETIPNSIKSNPRLRSDSTLL